MEQQHTSPETTSTNNRTRPGFLTVLCILSFVGIAFVVISALFNLFSYNSPASRNVLDQMGPLVNSVVQGIDFERMIYLSQIREIINIVAALICLAGVIMMWKLKKIGYFIYLVGEVAPIITSVVLFFNFSSNPFISLVFWIGNALAFVFSAAFIIMYGVNLKHMS
jgi:hypothetical protein